MTALVTLRSVIYVCLIPCLYTATHCVRHRSPTSPVITAGTDTSCHTTSLRLVLVAFTPVLNRSGEPRPAVLLFSLHRQPFTVFIPDHLHPLQAFRNHGSNRDHHVTKLWMTENRVLKPSNELRKVECVDDKQTWTSTCWDKRWGCRSRPSSIHSCSTNCIRLKASR